MKLVDHFANFLNDTVNLNQDRVNKLDSNIEAIQNFLRQAAWDAKISGFSAQGSWAHKTIIRPVDQGEFDADLLVHVDPVEGWTAKDYVKKLAKVFKDSATYGAKAKACDYCVTITYAGERKVDVAPLVVGRLHSDSFEVCNKKHDRFDRSEPQKYTAWLIEKNGYSGSNSFRKVTRLLKYLRDIKARFVCPSVLLTTLLANQIAEGDKDSAAFSDVPTALKTVMGRLDDWLQARPVKPQVCNPFVGQEDFAEGWTTKQYDTFRSSINRYRMWVDEAYDAEDRDESIGAWRKLFGDDFAYGVEVAKVSKVDGRFAYNDPAQAGRVPILSDLVELVSVFGRRAIPWNHRRAPHMSAPQWVDRQDPNLEISVAATINGGPNHRDSIEVSSGDVLQPGQQIYFQVKRTDGGSIAADYRVQWRITNTGNVPDLRGEFYGGDAVGWRIETLSWRGVHIAEAFLVRRNDGSLAAVSDPFYVVIE